MHKTYDIYDELAFFNRSEFNSPDEMDYGFLRYLDKVRGMTGIPFVLTSDGRDPEHNARVGGVETSLHLFDTEKGLLCRAVDFVFPYHYYKNRSVRWKAFWSLTEAVMQVAKNTKWHKATLHPYVQFEIVHSKVDRHFHLALLRAPTGPELIIAAD